MCILQGPVAARHATKKDEPIKELLGGIETSLIEKILNQFYEGDASKVPTVDYIGAPALRFSAASLPGVELSKSESSVTYKVSSPPDTYQWLDFLAGPSPTWLRAFLTSLIIVRDNSYIDSPIRRLFTPRAGQTVTLKYDQDKPVNVTVHGAARSFGTHKPEFKAIDVSYDSSSRKITLTLFEDRKDTTVALPFEFVFRPDQGFAPIHEVSEGRNKHIKEFYWKLWFGDDQTLPQIQLKDTYTGPEVTVDAATIERFCSVVGNQGESFTTARTENVKAPMDFGIVTGWQVS